MCAVDRFARIFPRLAPAKCICMYSSCDWFIKLSASLVISQISLVLVLRPL